MNVFCFCRVSFDDVVTRQRHLVLKLLVLKDEALLVGWDALLGSNQNLDVVYGVVGLDVVPGGVAVRVLHEDLHPRKHGVLAVAAKKTNWILKRFERIKIHYKKLLLLILAVRHNQMQR